MTTSTSRRRKGARRLRASGAATAAIALVTAASSYAAGPGAGGIGDPYYPAYGNGGYNVTSYDLFIDYVPGSGRITGTAIIKATATQDLTSFNLDLLLTAKSVTVNGTPTDFAKPDPHELVVKPATVLRSGSEMVVKVTYTGIPRTISYNGLNPWIGSGSEVIALGEPEIAAWWFPSNDHPRDKATFNFTFSVPKGLEAIGPGDLVGKTSGTTKDVWKWTTPQPMATYLAFMAIGQYDVQTGTMNKRPYTTAITTKGSLAVTRARTDVMRTPEVINWEASKFGSYPFKSTGGVVAGTDFGYALETQNRPVYTPAFWSGGSNIYVVVHENAHQWFGDSVSVRNWKDIWLNEGFASYAEWMWSDAKGEGTINELLAETYNGIPADATGFWGVSIGNPGAHNEFNDAVYVRGAMTLAALRNVVGDANLSTILRQWAANKQYGNGSIAEFTALAERVSGKNLDTFFRNWLTVKTKPKPTAENGLAGLRLTGTPTRSGATILANAKAFAAAHAKR